jgi:hypothetical protein
VHPFWLVGGAGNGSSGFSPTTLSKVSAWLRHTQTSSDLTEWTSQLDATNATSGPSNAPTAGTSAGNARPIATWAVAGNDAMQWSINSANFPRSKFWVRFWMRQPTSALETLFAVYNQTGGSSTRSIIAQTNTSGRLVIGVYDAGLGLRQGMTPITTLAAATWTWVAFIFDGSQTGDAKMIIKVNGGSALSLTYSGTGTPPSELNSATGNIVIGDLRFGTAFVPFNGSLGQNLFVGTDDLTAQEDTNLMNFEDPT